MTAPNHADEAPDRIEICVDFGLRGKHLDADEVTLRLGLQPTGLFRAGESHTIPDGRIMRRPWTAWRFASRPAIVSEDLRDHARYLLAALEPKAAEIRLLRAKADYSAIWIACSTTEGACGLTLDSSTVIRLCALVDDLNLSFLHIEEQDHPPSG